MEGMPVSLTHGRDEARLVEALLDGFGGQDILIAASTAGQVALSTPDNMGRILVVQRDLQGCFRVPGAGCLGRALVTQHPVLLVAGGQHCFFYLFSVFEL